MSSRLRRYVPHREVEELADAAIVKATLRVIEEGERGSFIGLAMKISRDLAVDWMRRSHRESLSPNEQLDDYPARAAERNHHLLDRLRRMAAILCEQGLTPKQRFVLDALLTNQSVERSSLKRRLGVSGRDLDGVIRALQRKVRKIDPEPPLRTARQSSTPLPAHQADRVSGRLDVYHSSNPRIVQEI